MRWLKAFGAFWYDFVIGDDWRLALAVVIGLGCTAGLHHAGLAGWWALPLAVVIALVASLRRALR